MASPQDLTLRFATRRNAFLFVGSLFVVAGMGSANHAAFGFGIFCIIMLFVEWLLDSGVAGAIQVRRVHYPRTFEGQQVTVDLEVTSLSRSAGYLVELVDSFPPSSNYHVRQLATHLPGQHQLHFRYREVCSRRRGLYLIGPVEVRSRDALGLFTFTQTTDELTRLLVYPQGEELTGFDVLGEGTHANIGAEVVRHIGRSEEFERLRPYRAGDPPRLIHWRSTARLRQPYVKEFERNVVTEVTIYCDLHLAALSGLGDLTSVEYRLKVAASVAQSAIRKHHLVRMVALKDPREETRMAGGSQHLIAMLDWMALLKPAGSGSFEERLLSEAVLLRRSSTIVLVMSSIHVNTDALEETISVLRQRRTRIIAVIVDERSFLKLRHEQEKYYQNAPPLQILASRLKQHGVVTYTVRNQESVQARLRTPV